MKRYLTFFVLIGLMGIISCSGGEEKQGKETKEMEKSPRKNMNNNVEKQLNKMDSLSTIMDNQAESIKEKMDSLDAALEEMEKEME